MGLRGMLCENIDVFLYWGLRGLGWGLRDAFRCFCVGS